MIKIIIIFSIIFCILFAINNKLLYISEYFNSNKFIVSIYDPDLSHKSSFGIGDYMRGLVYLYQNTNTFIIADYRKHIISNFLYNELMDNQDYPLIEENNIIVLSYNNVDVDTTIFDQEQLYLVTNTMFQNQNINPTITNNILKTFKMKPDFQYKFNLKFNNLNINNNFAILHIRLDDKYFNQDINIDDFNKLQEYIEDNIIESWDNRVLVMSNNKDIKNLLCNKYNFYQYKINPVHTDQLTDNKNNDKLLNDMEDTLIEFFTIAKSKIIFQFCDNEWQTSGFSKRISEIYNIDFIKI